MNRNVHLGLLALFACVTVASTPAAAQLPQQRPQQSQQPNVVFILADNVGYGDLGVAVAVRLSEP